MNEWKRPRLVDVVAPETLAEKLDAFMETPYASQFKTPSYRPLREAAEAYLRQQGLPLPPGE